MSEIYTNNNNNKSETVISGGFFEFDDGGCYAGDWVNGQAYGYGKCTGPQGKGEYAGTWKSGFEVSGVYTWPNGNTFEGEWLEGKRGGVGVETKGNWIYKGEWTQGLKGKYGIRFNLISEAKYEGAWVSGMQEGLGVETYIDESTYQGQWSKGMRHGFGIRKSVPRGIAAIYKSSGSTTSLRPSASLPSGLSNKNTSSVSSQDVMYGSTQDNRKHDDSDRDRGGFVLVEKSKPTVTTHHSLQRSRSFSLSRTLSKRFKVKISEGINGTEKIHPLGNAAFSSDPSNLCGSADTGRNSLLACSVDVNLASVIEIYSGEWKNDKRCGFGISQRSDGLRYEGEWFNDKRCGYGVTIFKDGTKEEGKYRNNELISSLNQKRKIFTRRKVKDRVDDSVGFAKKASDTANQKSEMALAKRRTAVSKATLADEAAKKARYFADIARKHASKFEISITADNALNEDENQEKTEVKKKKPIGRGESGDSQMSSWSGSSLPSKKNVSENIFQEDDNVFLNFQEKEIANPTNVKSQTSKSNAFDFDLSKHQIIKQPSTDESSRSKSPIKTKISQNDMRDYFNDSAPEFMNQGEEVSNQFSHLSSDNQPFKNNRTSINIITENDFHKESKIVPANNSLKEIQINSEESIRSQDNPRFVSLNNKDANNQKTTVATQELRKRFSIEHKSQEKQDFEDIPSLKSVGHKINIHDEERSTNLIVHGNKSNDSSIKVHDSAVIPTQPIKTDEIIMSRPESINNHHAIQRWWHQNSITIVFVAINFLFSTLFFWLWSYRD